MSYSAIMVRMKRFQTTQDLLIQADESLEAARYNVADWERIVECLRRNVTIDPEMHPPITVTLDDVRKVLSEKGARILDLAKHFRVTPETITALVEPADSGVEVAERGWLKLSEPK